MNLYLPLIPNRTHYVFYAGIVIANTHWLGYKACANEEIAFVGLRKKVVTNTDEILTINR